MTKDQKPIKELRCVNLESGAEAGITQPCLLSLIKSSNRLTD